MSYYPPNDNEMIYAVKDGVGLWSSASTTSSKLQTNNEHDDHTLRDYRAGELMGNVITKELYPSPDETERFIKIRYWTWENHGVGILGLIRENVQMFHEGYIAISDEPTGWIRASHRGTVQDTKESDSKRQEIENDVESTADVPTPTLIEKVMVDKKERWQITFPNGWKVYYDDWEKMTPNARRTNTSSKLIGNGLVDGKGSGSGKGDDSGGDGTTFFTTKNILIMAGIVLVAGIALTVYLMKRKTPKKAKS